MSTMSSLSFWRRRARALEEGVHDGKVTVLVFGQVQDGLEEGGENFDMPLIAEQEGEGIIRYGRW
jgi:hypothetical protein